MKILCAATNREIDEADAIDLGDNLLVDKQLVQSILDDDPEPRYHVRMAIARWLEAKGEKKEGILFRTLGRENSPEIPLLDELPPYEDE